MIARTTQVTLMKEDGNTFDEGNFVLTIEDEGSGEWVKIVEQQDEEHNIRIDPTEWPMLLEAIDGMMQEVNKCQQA
jgi:hypothetical protein